MGKKNIKNGLVLEIVSEKIVQARIEQDLTTEQLANRAGLSKRTIERFGAKENTPYLDTYLQITKALRLNPGTVLEEALAERKGFAIYSSNVFLENYARLSVEDKQIVHIVVERLLKK